MLSTKVKHSNKIYKIDMILIAMKMSGGVTLKEKAVHLHAFNFNISY